MKYIKAILIMLIFIQDTPSAKDRWSLQECIERAWASNLSVRKQDIETAICRNELNRSRMDFLPKLDITVGHSLDWGRSVDLQNLEIIRNRLSQATSASWNASAYLLDGLSRIYNLRRSRINLEMSVQETERIRREISISVLECYLKILLSTEILSTAKESFRSISEQRERTIMLVEAGRQPHSSLLEIESQLASERVQVVIAENQVKSDMLALQQLIDIPYSSRFTIVIPSPDALERNLNPGNTEEIYLQAQSMPAIRNAALAVERSKIDLKKAKGQYFPRISVTASYGSFYSSSTLAPDGSVYPFFRQFRDNINPTVSFGISIPLFNGLATMSGIKNAELEKRSMETEFRIRQQALYREIQSAVLDAEKYCMEMEAASANMESMKELFRCVEEKFNSGILNGTDYTVAKTNLIKARSEYIQAKYRFIFQMKILDFYKGLPFTI